MRSEEVMRPDAARPESVSTPPPIAHHPREPLKELLAKLKAFTQIWRCFSNPLQITLLRFGLIRMPVFSYRIKGPTGLSFTMLARPGTTSMADLFVLREVFVEETYADILPLLPRRAVNMLDVGANLGSFGVWLAARHGVARGRCFEPDPSSFRLCRFNLSFNGCAQVVPMPQAVGGSARVIQMRINTTRPGGNSIYGSAATEEETASIEVVPFAKILSESDGPIDLLKMDCEGAEWEIVDQTPAELWQRCAMIVAEIHGDPAGRHQPDDFRQLMEARGFRTHRWDGGHMGLYIGVRPSQS